MNAQLYVYTIINFWTRKQIYDIKLNRLDINMLQT